MLVSRHGQRYACKLPWQPSPSDEHTVEEQQQPDMNITALLLPLQDRPCPIKVHHLDIQFSLSPPPPLDFSKGYTVFKDIAQFTETATVF